MSADETPDNLLGTLRSELDDDDGVGLHPSFEVLAGLVVTVRTAYTSFRITPEQAARICSALRLEARDGNEWTVGATSGAWYKRRAGENVWQKSTLPINVAPIEGVTPSWLANGIAGEVLEAEKAAKRKVEQNDGSTGEHSATTNDAEGDDSFTRGAINPFQRKYVDEGTMPLVATNNPKTFVATSGMDVGWILEEWDALERETETVRAPTRGGITGKLPPELDPDEAMRHYLADSTGPAVRVGSDVEGDAPVERDGPLSPDDYFLRPND